MINTCSPHPHALFLSIKVKEKNEREKERENAKHILSGILGHDKQMGFVGASRAVEAMEIEAGKWGWIRVWRTSTLKTLAFVLQAFVLGSLVAVLEIKCVLIKDKDETLVPECGLKWKSCCSHFISKETEAQRLRNLLRPSQLGGRSDLGCTEFSSVATSDSCGWQGMRKKRKKGARARRTRSLLGTGTINSHDVLKGFLSGGSFLNNNKHFWITCSENPEIKMGKEIYQYGCANVLHTNLGTWLPAPLQGSISQRSISKRRKGREWIIQLPYH